MDCSVHCRLFPVAYLIIFVKQTYTRNRAYAISINYGCYHYGFTSPTEFNWAMIFVQFPNFAQGWYYYCSSCSRILARVLSKLCLKSWVVETTILMGSGLRHST